MFFKSRLARIERRIVPRERPKELKMRVVFSDEFVPQDKDKKPLRDCGEYEDNVLVVHVVKTENGGADAVTCPGPDNGGGDMTDALKAEIKRLEARRRELQAKAKA